MSATATADTTPDHCVCAPACWLIAERVSEPEPGMHWKKLPGRFATPSLRHCWFRSSFCRVTAAIAFAIEIASSSPRSAIASALVENMRTCTASMTGSCERGQRRGDLADDRDALLVEPEPRRRRRRDEDRDQELRQERPAEPPLDHAQEEHERDRAEPDRERRSVQPTRPPSS